MSNYDVALVVDAGTLNTGMTQLYANATAQDKLFKGNETVGTGGVVSVDWKIGAAPTFVLTPPDAKVWNDPNVFSPTTAPKPAAPTDQMFQLTLTAVTTTINLEQGDPVPLSFALTVFAQLNVTSEHVVMSSVAVLPINVEPAQELYLQIVCSIVYNKVSALLAGYKIPANINVEGQAFTPPVVAVIAGYLVVASNLTANGTPDISGVTWPQKPLGVLLGRKLLAALVNQYSTAIVQKLDDAKIDNSDSNWTGSYSLDGGVSNASIALASTLPNINITATVSATASVGVSWWLVPAACALEAASNIL